MNDTLETLADAISDVGVWTWWHNDSPKYFQVEFSGTQLWNPPVAEGKPPSGKIAVGFSDVASVSFLTFVTDGLGADWPQLLHQDEIDYFTLDHETFTFTDAAMIDEIIAEAIEIQTVSGPSPQETDWTTAPLKLVFRAGPVGLAIAARNLTLLNSQGNFGLNEIEEKNQQWWEYWKEYWRVKDTAAALPEDYACEVTIPAGGPVPEDED